MTTLHTSLRRLSVFDIRIVFIANMPSSNGGGSCAAAAGAAFRRRWGGTRPGWLGCDAVMGCGNAKPTSGLEVVASSEPLHYRHRVKFNLQHDGDTVRPLKTTPVRPINRGAS